MYVVRTLFCKQMIKLPLTYAWPAFLAHAYILVRPIAAVVMAVAQEVPVDVSAAIDAREQLGGDPVLVTLGRDDGTAYQQHEVTEAAKQFGILSISFKGVLFTGKLTGLLVKNY